MSSTYGFGAKIPTSYDQAIPLVTDALKTEGFGVLTEIDVQATLKKKLDVDVEPYIILGACNPKLAHRALQAEPELGLLLPCNIIVYDNGDGTSTVSIVDPLQMLGVVDNPALHSIAEEADSRLRRVLAALSVPVAA
ncbi:MAG: DUF302 domain-containing protein [Chloroflexi bacterium]|nr:DUF302 domain-containing protein [Chloroflexota bacterium]